VQKDGQHRSFPPDKLRQRVQDHLRGRQSRAKVCLSTFVLLLQVYIIYRNRISREICERLVAQNQDLYRRCHVDDEENPNAIDTFRMVSENLGTEFQKKTEYKYQIRNSKKPNIWYLLFGYICSNNSDQIPNNF
jgi:hypothetical protein